MEREDGSVEQEDGSVEREDSSVERCGNSRIDRSTPLASFHDTHVVDTTIRTFRSYIYHDHTTRARDSTHGHAP